MKFVVGNMGNENWKGGGMNVKRGRWGKWWEERGEEEEKEDQGESREMDGWNGQDRLEWKRFQLALRFKKPEQGVGTFDQFT